MVAYLFSLAFIIGIAYFSVPGSTLFSYHPFLMTVGYVGFFFQAILVFSKESSLFVNMPHKKKVNLHWIFNSLGLLCVLIAFGVIYYNKSSMGKDHFTSWHGLFGIITIVYTCIQYIAGHNLTILNNLFKKITNIPYSSLAIAHATSGTFLFVMICSSICLGINSVWFSNVTPFYIWYFAFALTGLFGLIVTNQVTAKYVKPKMAQQQSQPHVHVKSKKKKN